MIKVAAIIGMIVTAIILVAGNFHYSTVLSGKTVHDSASLSNIFDGFQLFPHGAWNFVGALQMVMFAFTSMEFIGMTAAETVNPKRVYQKQLIKFQYVFYFSMLEHFWLLWLFSTGTTFRLINLHLLWFFNLLNQMGSGAH